jgi:hypothetical protein
MKNQTSGEHYMQDDAKMRGNFVRKFERGGHFRGL